MIIELRTYTVKPGLRADFLDTFERRTVPAMRAVGMAVFGPLLDLENPDVFHWLRAFETPAERDRIRSAFYEGPAWKEELEALVMPMLESYAAVVAETPAGFVNFDGAKDLKLAPVCVDSLGR